MMLSIDQILEQSPIVGVYGNPEPYAFYSGGCCWWTSFESDMGVIKSKMMVNGKPVNSRIPCCPHCRSLLMQGSLKKFIDQAKADPSHYGRFGLLTFLKTHHRNSETCHKKWELYAPKVRAG